MKNITPDQNILIVDDEGIVTLHLEEVLSAHGYTVIGTAADGMEAYTQYLELQPKLVLMDIVMPREHGINAIKNIIQHDANANIIVLTGLQDKKTIMNALSAGAKDYLLKPFVEDELIKMVAKYCK